MSFFSTKTKGFIQLIFIIGFILFSFIVSGMLQSEKPMPQENNSQDRPLYVETETVQPGTYQIRFEATGVIESLTDIDVVPQVSGQVVSINEQFFEGGRFKKNEILFEIEPDDFELEVERLEAEVAKARTALTLEKAESKAALYEWRQVNGEKPASDLVARKPQMAEAEANLKAAHAQLKNAKLDLERTKVRLPFNGRVLSSMIAKGSYVSAGQSFAQVFDIDFLEVRASLQDQQMQWLLNEDKADITITTTYLGKTKNYKGFLKRGTSALDTGTRFAKISIGIIKQEDLLPGIFTTIEIKGENLQDITKLPATAIQKDGFIWTVNKKGRLTRINPNIIYASDDYIAVSGLKGFITVVTNRLDGATEGMKVFRSNKKNTTLSVRNKTQKIENLLLGELQ